MSLDPPLVAFFPDRKSTTWPKIENPGRFCVNVLSARQSDICTSLSSKAENKFGAVSYRLSPGGLPLHTAGTFAAWREIASEEKWLRTAWALE